MMLRMSIIALLAIVGLVGIAHADIYKFDFKNIEPQVEIYPVSSTGMTIVPDGYLYFYDFDMDTHNQTITLQSVNFVMNNTDQMLYQISGSTVGVEGNYDTIPLSSLAFYIDASTQQWSYGYKTPVIFTPELKDPTGKFTLSLFTPFKFYTNVGVSVQVTYLSNDGKTHIVKSTWNNIENIPDFNGIIYCTNQTCPPDQPYCCLTKQENQQMMDKLNLLIKLQNETNHLLAGQYCDLYPAGNYLGQQEGNGKPVYSVSREQCIVNYLESMK
jgi:hypothetical protein